jgi:hypothetical protein
MEPTVWKLEDRWAKLRLGKLAAAVDLLEPARGLHELWVEERPWHAARLLEVNIGSVAAPQLDAYVRDTDLVATYDQTETRPFRTQAYWRARGDRAAAAPPTLELVLSVQTSSWDSDPGLTVGSIVPGAECLRLVKPEEALYQRVSLWTEYHDGGTFDSLASKEVTVESFNGTGCFLIRPKKSDLSYVEMVHPADFGCSTVTTPHGLEGHCQLRHRLFARRLEKGVILRARVRSAFLPRHNDSTAAAALYREFAAAEPPLTT